MSNSSNEKNVEIDQTLNEDPLAALARIVSSGSVFGDAPVGATTNLQKPVEISATEPESGKVDPVSATAPVTEEVPNQVFDMEPAPEALAVSQEMFGDLDNALSAQLEVELVNELQVAPVVQVPAETDVETEHQSVDEIIVEIIVDGKPLADTFVEPETQTNLAIEEPSNFVSESETTEFVEEISEAQSVLESDLQSAPEAASQPIIQTESENAPQVDVNATSMELPIPANDADGIESSSDPIADIISNAGADQSANHNYVTALLKDRVAKANAASQVIEETAAPEAAEETPPVMSPDQPVSAHQNAQAVVEDALNLDSFFDEEFLKATSTSGKNKKAVEPNVDFDLFEAEIAATVTSGYPEFKSEHPVEVFETTEAHAVTEPVSVPVIDDVDPLDEIQLGDVDEGFEPVGAKPVEGRNRKGLLAIAAILLLAVVGGAGAYYWSAFGSPDEAPVVVAADDTPVRIKPDDPGGKSIPNQDRTVYETLSGSERTAEGDGTLTDRAEAPIVGIAKDESTIIPRVTLPKAEDELDDVITSTRPPRGPRSVRTVVVRPDGTLVQSNENTGSSEIKITEVTGILRRTNVTSNVGTLNQAEPEALVPRGVNTQVVSSPEVVSSSETVETVKAAETSIPSQTSSSIVADETVTTSSEKHLEALKALVAERTTDAELNEEEIAVREEVKEVPAIRVAALPPSPRPNTFRTENSGIRATQSRTSDGNRSTEPTPLTPRVVQASAPALVPAVASQESFVVQLSAQRSPEQARSTFENLKRRYSLLSNYEADIQRADLGAKGIYHRLRVGPFARSDANQICQNLRNAGGECIVRRN